MRTISFWTCDAENDLQMEHCPKCDATGCLMDIEEEKE